MASAGHSDPCDAERPSRGSDSHRAIPGEATDGYAPRSPEQTLLHRIVREQLENFLTHTRWRDQPAPRFVEEEFRAYLRCGVLAHGLLRVHCDDCRLDRLIPFSCKRRVPQQGAMSLHADVAVPARDRRRLERLCHYVARPPLASARLEERPDGGLALRLKTPWRDGTSHILMKPHELLERLVPLIPPPRAHQVRYHGVLAPCASARDRVVPGPRPTPELAMGGPEAKEASAEATPASVGTRTGSPETP